MERVGCTKHYKCYHRKKQIDSCLSRVEQSPSPSMWNALQPLMKTLTMKKYLRYPDMDVRIAVASCISEITRITAPDAPYDDDVMKEIFQTIIEAFKGLGDMSSRSFQKRVSILETVARVRSCVVMLDLECDALILDMFQHFLKTISDEHSENVFSSMEIIMTLVIEESEDITTELLSGLLNTLKKDKDQKDFLSISQRLAEKVMVNCASKIRSCLVELVQSAHAPLSEYNEVVASICQEDHKEANASGEVQEDDCKLSERTVSDEQPQASAKLEQEVGCPEKVSTSADTSPTVATSNGTVQMGNGDSMEQPSSPKQKTEHSHHNGKSKNALSDQADCDDVESVAVKPDSRTDSKKAKGRKTNSSGPLMDTAVSSQVGSHKDELMTSRGICYDKESDSSQVNEASTKEAEPAVSIDPEKKSDGSDNQTSVALPTERMLNSSRNKRGRRTGSKAAAKNSDADAAADQPVSPALKDPSGNGQIDGEAIPLKGDEYKETAHINESDVPVSIMSGSDVKPTRKSGKKGGSKRKVDHESSGRKQKSNNKKQKKEDIPGKDVGEEQSLKEMVSSLKASSLKTPRVDQSRLEVSAKPKSWKLDISDAPDCNKELDESLVGSKIKVWWPDDEMFYEGVVDSYDPDTMKHKVVYSDGDVEVLLLKDERYELVKIDSEKDGGKQKAKGSASQILFRPLTKKMVLSSNTLSNQPHARRQSESGTESSSKDAPKPRGRPRIGASNVGKLSFNDSSGTLNESKGKGASNDKAKTPKSSGKIKDEAPRTSSKREESGNKSKDERRSKGKDAIDDKAKAPKFSGELRDDPADETLKTSSKRDESTNRSKDDTFKPVKKFRNETPKVNTKSNDDARKGGGSSSKVGDGKSKSKDSTPKTVNRIDGEDTKSNDDARKGGGSSSKVGDGKSKSKDSTPKTVNRIDGEEESGNKSKDERKSKGKDAVNDAKTPKSKNETPKANTKSNDDTSKGGGSSSSSKVGDDKGKSKDSTPKIVNRIEGVEESGYKPKDGWKSKGKDAINDKAKTPKSSGKLRDDPAYETQKTASKRESTNMSKDETSKSVKKSKNETPKAQTKSNDDTPKKGGSGSSKLGDDKSKSKDSTPKKVYRIEGEEIDMDKMPKTKTKASNSTPKKGSDSRENGMSSKGNTKVGDSENTDFEAMTGAKKRKRKGRK